MAVSYNVGTAGMVKAEQGPLAHNEYFHGTTAMRAMLILSTGGFFTRSEYTRHDAMVGRGIYFTKRFPYACWWGSYIFRCHVEDTARLLRLAELARSLKDFAARRAAFGPILEFAPARRPA